MKTNKIYFILRIVVISGWISFLIYNFNLWRFITAEYNKDPSNFAFFEDEEQRQQYKITYPAMMDDDWIDRTSLVEQCRPMIYIQDLYFNKIDRFIKLTGLLIVLTLILKVDPREWKSTADKIKKLEEQVEDDK